MVADEDEFDPSTVFIYMGKGRVPKDVVRVRVDPSVRVIPAQAFERCRNLKHVWLCEGLRIIGRASFRKCCSLGDLRFPSSVIEIGEWAFSYCTNLASIHLPDGLREIGDDAFTKCSSMRSVRVPPSVSVIGSNAFLSCASLVTVHLQEGLQRIGGWAFMKCSSLESFQVPSSVVEIGDGAFYNCTNMTSVRLSKSLQKIGSNAFWGCPSLGRFYFSCLAERMEAISLDWQKEAQLEAKIAEISREMLIAQGRSCWKLRKESLEGIHEIITYWELERATAVLELALWKSKIEEEQDKEEKWESINNEERQHDLEDLVNGVKGLNLENESAEKPPMTRQDCQVKCGAEIIMKEVLKLFAYRTSL